MFSKLIEKISPPSSEKFFLQLKEISAEVLKGAQALSAAARSRALGTADFTAQIHAQENKVDALTGGFLLSVRHTMIHPVDPDDLRDIANGLDTVMDTIDHYSWRMEAYRLTPTTHMGRMIDMISEMVAELSGLFDSLNSNNIAAVDAKYRILSDLEKQADMIFHEGVKSLHSGGERCYTVEDEVLAILEDCTDRCKEAGQFVVVMLERNR